MNSKCTLCPRKCNTDRESRPGFCGERSEMRISRAALHFWEEPCISGTNGSGAVFFTGCNLRCIYCQNAAISENGRGKSVTADELAGIFFDLKARGAHNINLVTPSHFVPGIIKAIISAKDQGFDLPFVYNSSAYESVETLKMLEGMIDIYLPDLKYMDPKKAASYSHAADYPETAKAAIAEMYRQTGAPLFLPASAHDNTGIPADSYNPPAPGTVPLIKKGLIVRHLVLPLGVHNAFDVIDYLAETYGDNIYISIMSQYTPLYDVPGALSEAQKKRLAPYPELHRKVTRREYERVLSHIYDLDLANVFIQEGDTARESFIPEFYADP